MDHRHQGRKRGLRTPQLLEIPEQLQRSRISHRVAVMNRSAMDDVPNCQLGNLSADGPRYVVDSNNLPRHMMRTGVIPYLSLDPVRQLVRQRHLLPQPNEQNDPHVPLPILPNYKAFNDFRNRLDLAIDLRRPDPDPSWIERGVAPTQNDQPVVGGQSSPVAMTPYAGEILEVGLPVLR